jgi:hypothetical protein
MIFGTRLQTRGHKKEQRKRLTAQRKLTDGPCHAQGVVVSGVRGATTLFASKAQGKVHQDETREILYENSRLQVDGKFRCAASPDERAVLRGCSWVMGCQVRSCTRKCFGPAVSTKGELELKGGLLLRIWPLGNPMVCGEDSSEVSIVG